MKSANQVNAQPDQRIYYNSYQLRLPLNLEWTLDEDDALFSFLEATGRISFGRYIKEVRSSNTKSHSRSVLLRTMLFGYMNGVTSLSKLAELCKTDIRYLFLTNEEKPSKMAFSRMCESLRVNIDDLFFDLSSTIAEAMGCDTKTQYIDGTKIEANAHKNSFVYRKRIINARERLYFQITESICLLNQEYGYNYRLTNRYCAYDIWNITQYLMEVMVHEDIKIVYGIGRRKTEIQRYYDQFMAYAMKLDEYEYWLAIIGNRNSCSKVDFDATFMNTKFDYYNNTGLTRACYNAQIAVSDGIIVNSEIYQTPGDVTTYEPFMERYKENTGELPDNAVTDAAYGSYDNYLYNIRNGMNLTMKYPMYGKKEDKNYKKKTFETLNWPTTEEGYKICPDGRILSKFENDRYSTTRQGNLMISQMYHEERKCEGCKFREECIRNKAPYKRVGKNIAYEEMTNTVDEIYASDEGKSMKKERAVQVEGAFGVIKQNMGFVRFHRKGMKNVRMEFLMVCLGYNLKKYHIARLKRIAAAKGKLPA